LEVLVFTSLAMAQTLVTIQVDRILTKALKRVVTRRTPVTVLPTKQTFLRSAPQRRRRISHGEIREVLVRTGLLSKEGMGDMCV